MFRDLAAGCDVPTRGAMGLEDGDGVLWFPMLEPDQAIGGTFDGWTVGVSGTAERDGYKVVIVRDRDDDGPATGFGGVLRSTEGVARSVVSPLLVLYEGEDTGCLVGEVNPEDAAYVTGLLVRAAAGTLLAWTPPDEGGRLH